MTKAQCIKKQGEHNSVGSYENPQFARRSAAEVQSQLYLACDLHYITESERQHAYTLATETKRLINGLIAYLSRSS